MRRITYLLPATLAGSLGWAPAMAQQQPQQQPEPQSPPPPQDAAPGTAVGGNGATLTAPPAPDAAAGGTVVEVPALTRPDTPLQTIDRDGPGTAIDPSPAVQDDGGTWLWIAIAVIAVLVVLALLKFLIGTPRTRA